MFNCSTFYQVHEHGITDYIEYIIKLSLYKEEHYELPAIGSSADTKIKVNGGEVKIGNFFSSFSWLKMCNKFNWLQLNELSEKTIPQLAEYNVHVMYVIVEYNTYQIFFPSTFLYFLSKTFSHCFQKMAAQRQKLFPLTFRQIWNRYVQSVRHQSTDTKRLTTLKNAK